MTFRILNVRWILGLTVSTQQACTPAIILYTPKLHEQKLHPNLVLTADGTRNDPSSSSPAIPQFSATTRFVDWVGRFDGKRQQGLRVDGLWLALFLDAGCLFLPLGYLYRSCVLF